jgi:hypothetical protein
MSTTKIGAIPFQVRLKDLVHRLKHSGECSNCTRPFGQIRGIPERPRLQDFRMHCPFCGSGHVVSLKRSIVIIDQVAYMGLHCRKCGLDSNEYTVFTACEAAPPAVETKRIEKVQRLTNAVGMAPKEFLENLAQFQASRGKVSQVITEKLKEFESVEKADEVEKKEQEPQPGTPEWFEAHPEES